MSKKKPTAMEIKRVIENLIMTVSNLEARIEGIGIAFLHYIDFKKDGNEFEKFIIDGKEKDVKQKATRKSPNTK